MSNIPNSLMDFYGWGQVAKGVLLQKLKIFLKNTIF